MILKTTLALALFGVTSFAQPPHAKSSFPAALTSKVWKISSDPAPPLGSLYVFLSNGTLLETSCVETYRIATWRATRSDNAAITVTEEGRPAFNATLSMIDTRTIRMRQTLVRSKEVRELTLIAVDKEFVCPDMPR